MGRASVLPFLLTVRHPRDVGNPFVLRSGIRAGSAGSHYAHASKSAQCNTSVISLILLSVSLTLADAFSALQSWFKTAVTALFYIPKEFKHESFSPRFLARTRKTTITEAEPSIRWSSITTRSRASRAAFRCACFTAPGD